MLNGFNGSSQPYLVCSLRCLSSCSARSKYAWDVLLVICKTTTNIMFFPTLPSSARCNTMIKYFIVLLLLLQLLLLSLLLVLLILSLSFLFLKYNQQFTLSESEWSVRSTQPINLTFGNKISRGWPSWQQNKKKLSTCCWSPSTPHHRAENHWNYSKIALTVVQMLRHTSIFCSEEACLRVDEQPQHHVERVITKEEGNIIKRCFNEIPLILTLQIMKETAAD